MLQTEVCANNVFVLLAGAICVFAGVETSERWRNSVPEAIRGRQFIFPWFRLSSSG
jgi:hypothetical protein